MCSTRKGVVRNFTKFKGKHLFHSLFFNKVAGLRSATLLKKRLYHRCSHLWWLFLFNGNQIRQKLLWWGIGAENIWKVNNLLNRVLTRASWGSVNDPFPSIFLTNFMRTVKFIFFFLTCVYVLSTLVSWIIQSRPFLWISPGFATFIYGVFLLLH